ncbi:alpha/beta fold hydrolase [Streptomyces sp. TP-A0874]|uniref:alpha/beta fold hydrolase n=1 Tax=Streptomyces sp. TP-A0874 TaxID=549819 RepID=UPI000852C007|nr:alpha/beta fold hydrolase [Streptomyces sp. TP-A0874]
MSTPTPAQQGLAHHVLDGPTSGPPLILGPSLGTSLAVWEPQLAELARTHRVLRWDLPGHGGSAAAVLGPAADPPGETTVADLARLVLRLADQQGWRRFRYAGISLGGAVGAHLALHHPERVEALAMVCSSARFGPAQGWRDRARLVREQGTGPLLEGTAGRWFADPATAATDPGSGLLADLAAADPAGYAACCDALADYDLRSQLGGITAPTLVIAGREDPATPPAHARELVDAIPGASLLELAGAAHLAGVERPAAVSGALQAHLTSLPAAPRRN